MMANTVEDPNHDPNLYSEIVVSSALLRQVLKRAFSDKGIKFTESFSDEIFVDNLLGMVS